MRFTGKRMDRIRLPQQLRFPTDLAHHIRASAQMNTRTIEHQILHFVLLGIRYEELQGSKEELVTAGHIGPMLSQGVTR